MPLTTNAGVVCEDYRVGIGFIMLNGAEEVVVWVDKGALSTLSNISKSSEMAAFDNQRRALETIASANYDAGIIEPNGSTIIRREDVEALH